MFCSLLVCARWCCCCCCLPFFDYYLSHEFHLIWKISNFSSYSPFFVFFTSSWYFRCALLCFGSTGHTLQPTRRSFDTSLGNLVPLPPPSSIQNSSHLILWPVCEYICCWYLLSPTNMKRKHKLVIYGDSKYNFHLFFFILYFFFSSASFEAEIIACTMGRRRAGQVRPIRKTLTVRKIKLRIEHEQPTEQHIEYLRCEPSRISRVEFLFSFFVTVVDDVLIIVES